jgi:hypothetical protein
LRLHASLCHTAQFENRKFEIFNFKFSIFNSSAVGEAPHSEFVPAGNDAKQAKTWNIEAIFDPYLLCGPVRGTAGWAALLSDSRIEVGCEGLSCPIYGRDAASRHPFQAQ